MKVLHCPTETGGHAWGLSRAERALGVQSDVMVRHSSWLEFPCDVDLRLRDRSLPAGLLRLGWFFSHAVRRYDVFHFNWGMSLLDHRAWHVHHWDFPLLKRLGKRIIVTFQGCDARMKILSRERLSTSACAECDVAWCTPAMDQLRQKRIQKVCAYADHVFAVNPDLLHYLPGAEFLPYASVNPHEWIAGVASASPAAPAKPFRVLHMPTNRSIKGTKYVEQACTQLRAAGLPVDLMLVEGVPHWQVKELIARADVVVDQLLIGWYGALAVEAMAMGKPVLCYLRDDDLKRFVSFHERIPIVGTTKGTLVQDLRALLQSSTRRQVLGLAGRQFVLDVHDPMKIAQRTIAAYRG
ncbi:MAG: glycosyltransferase [Nitrospira sp.]|nr:glycosyltransferase [Nitrospira sp.]